MEISEFFYDDNLVNRHDDNAAFNSDRTKTVDLKQVNAVLMQPHWRHHTRDEPQQPPVFTNQKPKT